MIPAARRRRRARGAEPVADRWSPERTRRSPPSEPVHLGFRLAQTLLGGNSGFGFGGAGFGFGARLRLGGGAGFGFGARG